MSIDDLKKEMDKRFDQQDKLITKLINTINPLVTEVAVIKEKQRAVPKSNALWAGLGVLAGIIISLLTYILRLP